MFAAICLSEKKAMAFMLAQPSMIKRPPLDLGGGKLLVGFTPETYSEKVTVRG
jgi:arsenate reductase